MPRGWFVLARPKGLASAVDEPTMRFAAERGVARSRPCRSRLASATFAAASTGRFAGGRVSKRFSTSSARDLRSDGRHRAELRAGGPAVIVLGDGL